MREGSFLPAEVQNLVKKYLKEVLFELSHLALTLLARNILNQSDDLALSEHVL